MNKEVKLHKMFKDLNTHLADRLKSKLVTANAEKSINLTDKDLQVLLSLIGQISSEVYNNAYNSINLTIKDTLKE